MAPSPATTILDTLGPEGVFLRFVLNHTGRDDLFSLAPGAVMGSGAPARVFVAADHWLFADTTSTATSLLEQACALPWAQAVNWIAPGAPPRIDGWELGTDLLFSGAGHAGAASAVLSADALIAATDRLHPSLRGNIPPAPIRELLPFRFHGLVADGQIVALCDTTVYDSKWVVIQKVHTASGLLRRGHAKALVSGVLGFIQDQGRQAIWICDEDNIASRALAKTSGLTLQRRFPRLSKPR
jgi:hypothetical protein